MSKSKHSSVNTSIGRLKSDDLWKGLLDFFLIELIHFFFPERVASQQITQVIPLDKEFTQLIPQAYQKNRYADKLVKVIFDQDKTKPVHFHIEIQGYRDPHFSERMYVYDYRIYDRYGKEVENLAIFDRPAALPRNLTFSRNTLRNKREMAYYHYKVWEADTVFLENHTNPIAQAILAVKEGMKVKGKSDEEILAYKIWMVLLLLSKGYTEEQDQNLFIFVTRYVKFADPKMEFIFQQKLSQIIPNTKVMSLVELLKAKQKEAEAYAKKMGKEESTRKIVKNLLKSDAFLTGAIGYQDIALASTLSIEEVKQIHQEMGK